MTSTNQESTSPTSPKQRVEGPSSYLDKPNERGRQRVMIAFGFMLLLLIIDQGIKFWVKLSMMSGESIHVTDWCYIYFTENPGMAFGWEFFDKMFLTIFRIIASIAIAWLVVRTAKRSYSTGFMLCMAAICAGAIGNIIDSVFYGRLFTDSVGQVAQFASGGNGYADWMHGKVVDMFYFPIINTTWPSWMPIFGGEELIFFRPIFNFADACISVGVILLLICYSHSFTQLLSSDKGRHRTTTVDDASSDEMSQDL